MIPYCSLSVPPGALVKSGITSKECKKTKDVDNLRYMMKEPLTLSKPTDF